jgi:hypothetical protein
VQRLVTSAVLMLTGALGTAGRYTGPTRRPQRSTSLDLHEPAVPGAEVQSRSPHRALRRDQRHMDRAAPDAWPTGARTQHQRILVSFEHSRRSAGRARQLPSVRHFALALRRFHAAYPFVKEISPWNEANRCQDATGENPQGQPNCHNPKRVAQYYMAARKEFPDRWRRHSRRTKHQPHARVPQVIPALRQAASADHRPSQLLRHQPLLDAAHKADTRRLQRPGLVHRNRRNRQARHDPAVQPTPGRARSAACSPSRDPIGASPASTCTSSTPPPTRPPRDSTPG